MTVSLLPQEGQSRSLAKPRSSRKVSFWQLKLIPAFGLKIGHEFEEQRLGGFHQIRPTSLKLK